MTCPNKVVRKISPKGNVNFGAACNHCPLREICTKAKKGRKVVITAHQGRQRAHRATAKDPDFQYDYRKYRPMIERGVAWLVAGNNRRLRYIGAVKDAAWIQTRIAGFNHKRLRNLGLTHENEAWILVP